MKINRIAGLMPALFLALMLVVMPASAAWASSYSMEDLTFEVSDPNLDVIDEFGVDYIISQYDWTADYYRLMFDNGIGYVIANEYDDYYITIQAQSFSQPDFAGIDSDVLKNMFDESRESDIANSDVSDISEYEVLEYNGWKYAMADMISETNGVEYGATRAVTEVDGLLYTFTLYSFENYGPSENAKEALKSLLSTCDFGVSTGGSFTLGDQEDDDYAGDYYYEDDQDSIFKGALLKGLGGVISGLFFGGIAFAVAKLGKKGKGAKTTQAAAQSGDASAQTVTPVVEPVTPAVEPVTPVVEPYTPPVVEPVAPVVEPAVEPAAPQEQDLSEELDFPLDDGDDEATMMYEETMPVDDDLDLEQRLELEKEHWNEPTVG